MYQQISAEITKYTRVAVHLKRNRSITRRRLFVVKKNHIFLARIFPHRAVVQEYDEVQI